MEINFTLADIKRIRKTYDLTQKVLADIANISVGTLCKIERGKTNYPQIKTLRKLRFALIGYMTNEKDGKK